MTPTVNESFIDGIVRAIQQERLIVVAGAGVAAASTDMESARSWIALIKNGASYVESHVPDLPTSFRQIIDLQLANAQHGPTLISAAESVAGTLQAPDGHLFRDWLQDAVGNAPVQDERLIRSIARLGRPIATTNYDTFFESVLGRVARTWRDAEALQSALAGVTQDISHLHGVWTEPESVILGAQSYGALSRSVTAQGLERATGVLRSILFVGCGAGLADPNFGKLLDWLRQHFENASVRHFRLCTDDEVEALRAAHQNDPVDVVSYGPSHSDLPAFFDAITSASNITANASVAVSAARDLTSKVRSESIFADRIANIETRAIDELIVPPVILPVPHEQFVAAQRDPEAPPLSRVDLANDLALHDCQIIVGEETSGLSTALTYMVTQAAQADNRIAPTVLDFRGFTGLHPVDRALRISLRAAGVAISNSDPIPRAAVAVDNVQPSDRGVYPKMMDELANMRPTLLLIGCRPGSQADIDQHLRAAGYRPATRYLGRLNTKDIESVAALVAPTQAHVLAQRAVTIIKKEHLARTPLTICLLISVLLAGEALLSTSSETALLDAYLSLLLGRGSAYDDARYVLDSHDNTSLLAELAATFIRENSAALTESAVTGCFESYFIRVGWAESASETLNALVRRHVLVRRNGRIQFAQASFLHLFAAKMAIDEAEFLDSMLAAPVSYMSILRHYAALKRNDRRLVRAMLELAERNISTNERELARGANLSAVQRSTVGQDAENRLLESLDPVEYSTSAETGGSSESTNTNGSSIDPLDEVLDDDLEPFTPLRTADHEVPPLPRTIQALTLISGVLRDSESLSDLDLKEQTLTATLRLWGQLVDAFEADDSFHEFVRAGMVAVVEEVAGGTSAEHKERLVEYLVDLSPILSAMSGMTLTLASRKLMVTLAKVLNTNDSRRDAGVAIMGALLSFDLRQEGWSEAFALAFANHPDVSAVASLLRSLAMYSYYEERSLGPTDAETLRDFLAEQIARRRGTPGTSEYKTAKSRAAQRLERNRLTKAVKAVHQVE